MTLPNAITLNGTCRLIASHAAGCFRLYIHRGKLEIIPSRVLDLCSEQGLGLVAGKDGLAESEQSSSAQAIQR
jgi:hypothetical protein